METIRIDLILPNPEQPRVEFPAEELQGLAASIQANGLIQPIVVEAVDDESYILHDGERRLRACQSLGWMEIPAVVVPPLNGTGAHDRLMRALVANVQRQDLNPVEEAKAYARLRDEHGLSCQDIADRVGTYYGRVINRLALLKLDEEILPLVANKALPCDTRVVGAIVAVEDRQARLTLAEKAAAGRYSNSAIIRAASQLQKAAEAVRIAGSAASAPGMQLGIGKSRQKLVMPAWDALAQVGRVLPWDIVIGATLKTCNGCALRAMASEVTCRECPLPQMLGFAIDLAMAADENKGKKR